MITLRHLVATMGSLALVPGMVAEDLGKDAVPVVNFSGWVDAVGAGYGNNSVHDGIWTAASDNAWSARFSAAASLKTDLQLGNQISGRINLWFNPDSDLLRMREASINYQVVDSLTVKAGKYISSIGWISPEPTGLYTVNPSLIGYLGSYGNDVLGVTLLWNENYSADRPVVARIQVNNGYFSSWDGLNYQNSQDGVPGYGAALPSDRQGNRENHDLGYGLDLTWYLPDRKGTLDLNIAYDRHSRLNGRTGDTGVPFPTTPTEPPFNYSSNALGGGVLLAGLNTRLALTNSLLLGGEIMATKVEDSANDNVPDYLGRDRASTYQGLLMASHKLGTVPCPMSLTVMWQRVCRLSEMPEGTSDLYTNKVTKDSGQVALFTNPTRNEKFAVNLEFGIWTAQYEDNSTGAINQRERERGWAATLEALLAF